MLGNAAASISELTAFNGETESISGGGVKPIAVGRYQKAPSQRMKNECIQTPLP